MPNLFLVMLGGALGAALRYEVGRWSPRLLGTAFPWATLSVNLTGGLLMGMLTGYLLRNGPNDSVQLLLSVGVLGGFTTFSAFALDSFRLLEGGQTAFFLLYAAVSVIGSIILLAAGLWLTRSIL